MPWTEGDTREGVIRRLSTLRRGDASGGWAVFSAVKGKVRVCYAGRSGRPLASVFRAIEHKHEEEQERSVSYVKHHSLAAQFMLTALRFAHYLAAGGEKFGHFFVNSHYCYGGSISFSKENAGPWKEVCACILLFEKS